MGRVSYACPAPVFASRSRSAEAGNEPRCGRNWTQTSGRPPRIRPEPRCAADPSCVGRTRLGVHRKTASASMRRQGLDGSSPCVPVKAGCNCVLPRMPVHDGILRGGGLAGVGFRADRGTPLHLHDVRSWASAVGWPDRRVLGRRHAGLVGDPKTDFYDGGQRAARQDPITVTGPGSRHSATAPGSTSPGATSLPSNTNNS